MNLNGIKIIFFMSVSSSTKAVLGEFYILDIKQNERIVINFVSI